MEQFLTQATLLAALAVVGVQQFLKLRIIPLGFANKYPVPTLIVLAVIAAAIVVLQQGVVITAWTDWLILVASIAVIAALTYRTTLRDWQELRSLEGTGTK